ncbi:hypothetical protein QJ850_gp543 [Acanthamoeba polyphaga mimivirus]|uniref:Uncharacterized protein n=1 Tax=Acanthamoeba polyphaga mimivirus Kroon TaxID=3069720 RepID=A0A0G2YAN9_9VIRU|nr:hypothetical protein QJ850_gp543 [Acanthamoeba polyphaga mimivirus]AKI80156.1 hypothetical protein [Acanthamoeba polyphaga mimivirus Kroon]
MSGNVCNRCNDGLMVNYPFLSCQKCIYLAKKNNKCLGVSIKGKHCPYKPSNNCGNIYCKNHTNQFRLHGKAHTHKLCSSGSNCFKEDATIKNLKQILPIDYPFAQCETCRNSERSYFNNKLQKAEQHNAESKDTMICKKCFVELPTNKFPKTSRGKISHYCKPCFDKRAIIERNRIIDPVKERERSKKYENRPDIKQKRKKYRQCKVVKIRNAISLKKSREKLRASDPENYLKKKAEQQAKHRQKYPEKKGITTIRYNTISSDKYMRYKSVAIEKGLEFTLTKQEFEKLVESNCYYCDCKYKNTINGIDRIDNNIGYILDNCVTACSMCNNMKNTLNVETFIVMCMTIANYFKYYRTDIFVNVFNNYKSASYNNYKNRALKKDLEFQLSNKEFKELQQKFCYLCGRKSNNEHTNGIDRVCNEEGYTLTNSRSCCGDCNYLKKDYKLDNVVFRCAFIALMHKNNAKKLQDDWKPSRFHESNDKKLSKDENREIKLSIRENKEKQRKKSVEKSVSKLQNQLNRLLNKNTIEI